GDAASVLRQTRFPTPRHGRALADIVDRVEEFVNGQQVASFGIALPGIINDADGTVVTSTNLTWLEGQAPARILGAALRAPGAMVNDGAATARAEVTLGAARGHSDAFVLALGTGIAGAHVVDGRIRRGAHGAAGEIGHISLGGDRICSCGQRGCLETYIGGSQLSERWRELSGRAGTARDLVEAADRGDAGASAVLDDATSALARSVLGLVALVDPGIIVVGGGVARAHAQVVEPMAAKARALATFHHLPPIVPATLGIWGAAWGAVLAAREN
ncbi:MAG: ROK family protein, partial [Propionibacteriaceae bacterium]|nr:ROK family protein [Propionibacteriaceae bacterium]